jgi:hypothetical protein
MQAPSL